MVSSLLLCFRVDELSDNDENAICETTDSCDDGSDRDSPVDDEKIKQTEVKIAQPDRLQLSFERISATGMYLLDVGDMIYLYLSRGLHALILERIFGVTRLNQVITIFLLSRMTMQRL